MTGQVAVENVLDTSAVIQEAQQGAPILCGVPDRVPHDDDIEAPLLLREAIPLPFPLCDQRRPIANIDEKATDLLFIKREIHVVPLVFPEQVDDRIEGGLVIHKAHLEEKLDCAHPRLALRLTRRGRAVGRRHGRASRSARDRACARRSAPVGRVAVGPVTRRCSRRCSAHVAHRVGALLAQAVVA